MVHRWIMFEPYDGNIKPLQNGFLGFDLQRGTTYEQAKDFAKLLNERIARTSFTDMRNPL